MSRKPFSNHDYKTNDLKAKKLAIEFLVKSGLFKLEVPLTQQVERYKAWDFFITFLPSNKKQYIETQRKHGWKMSGGWEWRFKTVHIEERKCDSQADFLIMFNYHWDTLLIGDMKKILEAGVIKKDCVLSNGKILEDDHFYEISPHMFDFYYQDSKGWRLTKP